jgi:hypothetical protein
MAPGPFATSQTLTFPQFDPALGEWTGIRSRCKGASAEKGHEV